MNDRYISHYAQGILLSINRPGLDVYRKYPSRLYGSLHRARDQAIKERDRLLREAGGDPRRTSRHIEKRKGAPSSFNGYPLPPGMSVQYTRGSPHYFVVNHPGSPKKYRFSIKSLGVEEAHKKAIDLLYNFS